MKRFGFSYDGEAVFKVLGKMGFGREFVEIVKVFILNEVTAMMDRRRIQSGDRDRRGVRQSFRQFGREFERRREGDIIGNEIEERREI